MVATFGTEFRIRLFFVPDGPIFFCCWCTPPLGAQYTLRALWGLFNNFGLTPSISVSDSDFIVVVVRGMNLLIPNLSKSGKSEYSEWFNHACDCIVCLRLPEFRYWHCSLGPSLLPQLFDSIVSIFTQWGYICLVHILPWPQTIEFQFFSISWPLFSGMLYFPDCWTNWVMSLVWKNRILLIQFRSKYPEIAIFWVKGHILIENL